MLKVLGFCKNIAAIVVTVFCSLLIGAVLGISMLVDLKGRAGVL